MARRRPRLVVVHWDDVTGETGGWKHDDDIDEWAAEVVYHCRSVGWLIREDPEFVVLAARATEPYLAGDRDNGLAQIGDLQRIPRVLVRRIERLPA